MFRHGARLKYAAPALGKQNTGPCPNHRSWSLVADRGNPNLDRSRLVGSLFQADANRTAMVAARTIPPMVGVGASSIHGDRTALCAGTQPTGIEASDDSWGRSRDCYLAGAGLGARFLFSSLWRAKVRQIFWISGGPRGIHDLALLQRDRRPSRRRDQFKTEDRKRVRLLAIVATAPDPPENSMQPMPDVTPAKLKMQRCAAGLSPVNE